MFVDRVSLSKRCARASPTAVFKKSGDFETQLQKINIIWFFNFVNKKQKRGNNHCKIISKKFHLRFCGCCGAKFGRLGRKIGMPGIAGRLLLSLSEFLWAIILSLETKPKINKKKIIKSQPHRLKFKWQITQRMCTVQGCHHISKSACSKLYVPAIIHHDDNHTRKNKWT